MWAVYECDLIGRGETPKNEVMVEAGFETAGKAMDRANELKRFNRGKSYMVGGA
jgi:hypothetical protein